MLYNTKLSSFHSTDILKLSNFKLDYEKESKSEELSNLI